MANIFAILTAVVLAISAFLAYQNMGRADDPGRGYKGWVTKREQEQTDLALKQSELAATQKTLDETATALTDLDKQNEGLQTQVDGQLATNEELQKEVEAAKADAEQKGAEVEAKRQSIEEIGEPREVLAEFERVRKQIAELDRDISQAEAQQFALESQLVDIDQALGNVRERIGWRVQGRSNPDLNTRVRSVYQNLGFVTLAGGDNLGIVKDSRLEVVRGGEVIAELQVTTVEAGTAAADVVPDSVVEGESVRAGDRVRARAGAPAPPAPAAGPGAPAPADAAAPGEAASPEPEEPLPGFEEDFPEPDPDMEAVPEPEPEAEAELPAEDENPFD